MAERPPGAPGATPGPADRLDAAFALRRDAAVRVAAGAAPDIPTLTDLVSRPERAMPAPPAEAVAPAAADRPRPVAPGGAPQSVAQRQALEDALFERLRERLDAEVTDLLRRQIVPEISARLEAAAEVLSERLHDAAREAVAQALHEPTPPGQN